MDDNIKRKTKVRYYSLLQRSKNLKIEIPKKKDIFEIVEKNIENGFKCGYCKSLLDINPPYPYKTVLSIDHKIPLIDGGTNKKENLFVCCHRCNIVKGSMKYENFLKLLEALKKGNILDKILDDMFRSAFANKIERVKIEKKKMKKKIKIEIFKKNNTVKKKYIKLPWIRI